MNANLRRSAYALVLGVALLCPAAARALPLSEDAYRANNIGVALLEQFKYKDGVEQFRRALELDPKLALARINLAIALYNVPDLAAATTAAQAALAVVPDAPQPHYILGLIARTQNKPDAAIAEFTRVLAVDPSDVGANVNLGQVYSQQRKFPEAVAAFRVALSAEPYNITAAYNLATALARTGAKDESQQMFARFQTLRQSGAGTSIGPNYLEQGRFAEAVSSTGQEPALVSSATPAVTFTDATAASIPAMPPPAQLLVGGGVTLFDFDGDRDLDMFITGQTADRLLRNTGGKFTDVADAFGAARPASEGLGAVAGDYDNDGRPDLFVFRPGSFTLYHNDGDGKFSDRTKAAAIPAFPYVARSAAFVDADHDGDVDILVAGYAALSQPAGAAPNLLARNNGDGTFTDVTAEAKVAGGAGATVAVIPTDFDNRRDVDLVLVGDGRAPALLRNLRDHTFVDIGSTAGLGGADAYTSAAAGDLNKDGFPDLVLGRSGAPARVALSDSKGRFAMADLPAGTRDAQALNVLDYDNDGLLDVVAVTPAGVRVARNIGGTWADVSDAATRGLAKPADVGSLRASLASGDLDGDGDTDLVLFNGPFDVRILRNDGGNTNGAIAVDLTGRVSNRSAIGSKVEVRAGSLLDRLETFSASPAPAPSDVLMGLGTRKSVDAVRIIWPSGVVQAETAIAAPKPPALMLSLDVTELDRKPSSCPFLYAWNGERFEFVTDFMGGGEMGYLEEPGVFNHPDADEYVRIRGDQLVPRDGRYDLRITNELEEVLYVDRLQLVAVAHPVGTEVFPVEGLLPAPPRFELVTTRDAHAPVRATDGNGTDWTASVARLDRDFVKGFEFESIRGYAKTHTLTLDLGATSDARTLLLLTGWTDYAFSSDNVAASQRGLELAFPSLQVRDEKGEWRTVIDNIGIPIGRPQTLVVDLTGKWLSTNREVRIVTNARVYWDQILVDTSDERAGMKIERLDPTTANLGWRGFSAETAPDGIEPWTYDYDRVSSVSPWKVFTGRYTREGDVRELVERTDDLFVVSLPGDEISVSFDAARLAPLPQGWTRTFLLYADGFSKEMDVNSVSPYSVEPYPFHGMSGYPYPDSEQFPMTPERAAVYERYNTRVVTSSVQVIDSQAVPITKTPRNPR